MQNAPDAPQGQLGVIERQETALNVDQISAGLNRLLARLNSPRPPFLILVEDDERDAKLLKAALQKAGAVVEFMHFKSVGQAWDFFQGKGPYADRDMYPLPNLTIVDFRLGRNSGLELLELIRNTPHLKELAVVGLSGSKDNQEYELAGRLKIDDCIHKPATFLGLIAVAERLWLTWLDKDMPLDEKQSEVEGG